MASTPDALHLTERPKAATLHMIAGWRQWADGGSVSSGLPQYLIQQTEARQIGTLLNDGFYLFQIPGTHDLVRPVIKFDEGYPKSLETQRNTFHYIGDAEQGTVFFLGDEPHIDVERYCAALLDAAQALSVKRIVVLGGVYAELPHDKERSVGGLYSLRRMKSEMADLAVNLSDYHGGASIGSYLCRRAGERNMECVGLYAFVPTYDFSALVQRGSSIRIENDYIAWRGIIRRINYMLGTRFALDDLDRKSSQLLRAIEDKIDELELLAPQAGIREYIQQLAENFTETPFAPLADVWEDELRRLLDSDSGDEV